MKKITMALVAAFVLAGFAILSEGKLNALATPLGAVKAFSVTCGTTETKITGGIPYRTVRCSNPSATLTAYIDGSDTFSTADAYELGGPTATDNALTVETTNPLYCKTSSGTTPIKCIGGQ